MFYEKISDGEFYLALAAGLGLFCGEDDGGSSATPGCVLGFN